MSCIFFIIMIIFLITIFFKCDSQKIQFGRYLCLAFNSYINMLKFIALDIKVCTPSELSPQFKFLEMQSLSQKKCLFKIFQINCQAAHHRGCSILPSVHEGICLPKSCPLYAGQQVLVEQTPSEPSQNLQSYTVIIIEITTVIVNCTVTAIRALKSTEHIPWCEKMIV